MGLDTYIPSVSKGDKSLSAKTMNSIIDSVNIFNTSGFDPSTTHVSTSDGRSNNVINVVENQEHPFKIGIVGNDNISITKGNWVRNQTNVTLQANTTSGSIQDEYLDDQVLVDVSNFTNAGSSETPIADTDYYVYVELLSNVSATTYNFDEALVPGELNVLVDRDANTAHVRNPNYVAENIDGDTSTLNYWTKTKEVLGTVRLAKEGSNIFLSSINQKINEDIIDTQIIPDSDGLYEVGENLSIRNTIDYNRVVDTSSSSIQHFGELQLYGIDTCAGKDSLAIPAFVSTTTDNTLKGPAGNLLWTSLDSYYRPQGTGAATNSGGIHLSFEIWKDQDQYNRPNENEPWSNNNSFGVLGLYGTTRTPKSSKSMCYFLSDEDDDGGQMQGYLAWASLDTHLFSQAYQKSLEIKADANGSGESIVQLFGFDSRTNHTLEEEDRLLIRDNDGGSDTGGGSGAGLKYADAGSVAEWINTYGGVVFQADYAATAGYASVAGSSGTITGSHDHFDHYFNSDDHVTAYQDRYCNVDGDESRNDFSSGACIGDSSGTKSIHPHSRILFDSAENAALDWGSRTLDSDPWTVTDTTAAASGAGCLKLNGGLYSANGIYALKGSSVSAGYFDDLTTDVTLAGGAIAGIFNNGVVNVKISSGTVGVEAVGLAHDFIASGSGKINATSEYQINGTKVVGAQGAAITAPSATSGTATANGVGFVSTAEFNNAMTSIGTLKTAIDQINSRLQAHGLIL